jgi:hypothetical protein
VRKWLEEGDADAIEAVETAGVPEKALWKGLSQLRRHMPGGRANSTSYRYESSAELTWHAYVLNVGEEPLLRQSTTPLLVNLEEVGAREGSHVMKRLYQLTNWGPQDSGNTVFRGRESETIFEGAASAKEVRAKHAVHVEQIDIRW